MNEKTLKVALVIALIAGGGIAGVFLPTTNGNQVQESTLLDLNKSLVADEDLGNYQVEITWLGGYRNVSLWLEKDQGIYGEFETTNQTAVTLMVLDSENFNFFQLGQSYDSMVWIYNKWHSDFLFETDITDMWHFVFRPYIMDIGSCVASLDLYRDTDPPEISLSLEDGDTCEGVATIAINVTEPAFYVMDVDLSIDGIVVSYAFEWGNDWDFLSSSQELTYEWDTEDYSDGSHSITVLAEDSLGHSTEKTITVEVDNLPPTEDQPALDNIIIGAVVGAVCIAIVIVLVLWRRR